MQLSPTVITIIGWLIPIIVVLTSAYFGFRPRAAEKETQEFNALVKHREYLEQQLKDKDAEKYQLKVQINQLTDQINKLHPLEIELASLKAENGHLHEEISKLKIDLENKLEEMDVLNDRLLEAQIISSIVQQQKEEMARRFGIRTRVSDLKKRV